MTERFYRSWISYSMPDEWQSNSRSQVDCRANMALSFPGRDIL